MSYRPHGRAEVDSSSPRAFGVCDRCGMWYNHYKLSWQREWAGTTQLNLHILVCEYCLDELQPQLRTVILPPDPPSIINARVETFSLDETGGITSQRLVGVRGTASIGSLILNSWVLKSGGVLATLDLDFVNGRGWSAGANVSLTSLLTCTRASTGYYTNAEGVLSSFGNNVLRYGDNGLLVEESRTNNVSSSNDLNSTNWTGNDNQTKTGGQTAPDGSTNAVLLTDNAVNGPHRTYQTGLTTVASPTCVSLYVQAGTLGFVQLLLFDGSTNNFGNFILSGSGSAGHASAGVTQTITALANGWYRCVMSLTPAASAGGANMQVVMINSDINGSAPAYVGSGSTLVCFGAQFETGAFPTSYIPTTSSSATRAADLDTLTSVTGLTAQGTWVLYYNMNTAASNKDVLSYGTVSAGKLLEFFVSSTPQAVLNWFSTGTGGIGSSLSTNTLVKGAFNFDSSGHVAAVSNASAAVSSSSSDYTGAATAIALGARSDATQSLNGYITRATFWNTRLSSAAMQTLTT